MKQGNELIPKRKKSKKVYLYMDEEFKLDEENVFISGVYSNVKQFIKSNEGMKPLVEYDAEHLIKTLTKQLEEK